MLIEFSVANYRSFRDRVTLSLRAEADDWLEPSRVTTTADGERLLRSVALYGLNSGGKTNLLRAFQAMRRITKEATPLLSGEIDLSADPFVLSSETRDAPSEFEIVISVDAGRFRYGFQITNKGVVAEWLFEQKENSETKLFTRQNSGIEITNAFSEAEGVVERTREDVLFLTAVAGWNGGTAKQIESWFSGLQTILSLRGTDFSALTAHRLEANPELSERVVQLAVAAKLGFSELRVELEEKEPPLQSGPPGKRYTAPRVKTVHNTFHPVEGSRTEVAALGAVVFDLQRDESAGTSKFVSMAVPFLLALRQGSVLVVDELEARMHPALTRQLLDLFHGPLNTKGAQLIFATHDTHLLDPAGIRRDQVYFVDKDERGASNLTRLSQYDVTADADFERLYLLDLFGATPGAPDFTEALRNGRGSE